MTVTTSPGNITSKQPLIRNIKIRTTFLENSNTLTRNITVLRQFYKRYDKKTSEEKFESLNTFY